MKKYIRLLIPVPLRTALKKWIVKVRVLVLRLFSSRAFLSSVYYAVLSRDFGREHQSVLYGQLSYQKVLTEGQAPRYLIRRNIHRLEKGLLMNPRRDLFGLEYLLQTVQAYKTARDIEGKTGAHFSELTWAREILLQYFSVVRAHATVDRARKIFFELEAGSEASCDLVRVPYKRNLDIPGSLDYESLLQLAKRRRSVRWYLQKAVPRELIDQAIEVALLSPSACNRQPFEFRIYDEPKLVRTIATLPWGTSGYRDNIPVIVALIGEQKAYDAGRDRHLIYIDTSLAAMSFMLALETLGLSSCALNWPDLPEPEREAAKLLHLKPDERPIMFIALGYSDPEGLIACSQKKSLDEIRSYNKL